jgi:hypothetical protein
LSLYRIRGVNVVIEDLLLLNDCALETDWMAQGFCSWAAAWGYDAGAGEEFAGLLGDEVELAIDGLGVVGKQDAEAVADGDAGSDDEEAVGEAAVVGVGEAVEGLPGD